MKGWTLSTNKFLAVMATVLVFFGFYMHETRLRECERQLKQACNVLQGVTAYNGEGNLVIANYGKLQRGEYILRFANYTNNSALCEYVAWDDPRRSAMAYNSWRPHYVVIYHIPKEVLEDWEWCETRCSPCLKRGYPRG